MSVLRQVIPFGVWTHLAVAFNGKHVTLYVNGDAVQSSAVTGTCGHVTYCFLLSILSSVCTPYSTIQLNTHVSSMHTTYTCTYVQTNTVMYVYVRMKASTHVRTHARTHARTHSLSPVDMLHTILFLSFVLT